MLVCLDAGHYHPTESMADKVSSVLAHLPEILLHVSRGVRWDSDHVVVLDDHLRDIAREIVVGDFIERTHIGLDYFDASINRIAAWTAGVRNMQKALLLALLDPDCTPWLSPSLAGSDAAAARDAPSAAPGKFRIQLVSQSKLRVPIIV